MGERAKPGYQCLVTKIQHGVLPHQEQSRRFEAASSRCFEQYQGFTGCFYYGRCLSYSFLFNIRNGRPELNTRTAKLKRYNIIHEHLDCLFYPMNDSVESDIEDTFKKGLISSEESSTIYVFCKQKLSDRAILPNNNNPAYPIDANR